jgi:hypothetical protein
MSASTVQNLISDTGNFEDTVNKSPVQFPSSVVADNSKSVNQAPIMSHWLTTNDPYVIHVLNAPENIKKELMNEWESIMTLHSRMSVTSRPEVCITTNTVISLNKQLEVLKAPEISPIEIHTSDQEKEEFYNSGYKYFHGIGIKKDFVKAAEWFKKAADLGCANAQCILGDMYKQGEGIEKNVAQAITWYKKSAEFDNPIAQYNMGLLCESGEIIDHDGVQAAGWYRKAAEQGYAEAQSNLGVMYRSGRGTSKDLILAVDWLTKAARQGHAGAQHNLGSMYISGEGVVKNLPLAFYWYRHAAQNGILVAQYILGKMYLQGCGVKQDWTMAVYWFSVTAEQGHADAQYHLAKRYAKGEGVNQNLARAIYWFKKAGEQGRSSAQFKLGLMYYGGQGVKNDFSEASYWFKQAAEQGHVFAQYNYGVLLSLGLGVKQNKSEAFVWYEKAARQNDKKSQLRLVRGFFEGIELTKDFKRAAYWLLRWGLSKNAKAIKLAHHNYFGLVHFFPEALRNFSEFNKVTVLEFSDFPAQAKGQMGSVFAELIKTNLNLISLRAPTYSINDEEALMIMKALDSNTTLKDIVLRYDNLTAPTGKFKKIKTIVSKQLPGIFDPDMKSQFLAVCSHNKDIFELREYLKNYLQTMNEPLKKFFDELPSEVMYLLADQIIITSIRKRFGKSKTKALLDEFLISSMRQTLTR